MISKRAIKLFFPALTTLAMRRARQFRSIQGGCAKSTGDRASEAGNTRYTQIADVIDKKTK